MILSWETRTCSVDSQCLHLIARAPDRLSRLFVHFQLTCLRWQTRFWSIYWCLCSVWCLSKVILHFWRCVKHSHCKKNNVSTVEIFVLLFNSTKDFRNWFMSSYIHWRSKHLDLCCKYSSKWLWQGLVIIAFLNVVELQVLENGYSYGYRNLWVVESRAVEEIFA